MIGIVASRLIETHYRPTLVFTKVANFNGRHDLFEDLMSVKHFKIVVNLEQFGGHKYAAGLDQRTKLYGV